MDLQETQKNYNSTPLEAMDEDSGPLKGRVVLVVDDEAEIRLLLSAILKGMGYVTEDAGTLAEARALVREKSPDLLFMDINLHDGNGLDEIPNMRDIAGNMSIVMMSAYDTPEARKSASDHGAKAFLSKPFSRSEVTEVVSKIFNLPNHTSWSES